MNASSRWLWAVLGLFGAVAVVLLFSDLARSEHRTLEERAWRELVDAWEAGKHGYVAYFVEHSYDDELVRTYGRFTPREGEEAEHARRVREVREALRRSAVGEPDPAEDGITRRGGEFWQRTRRIRIARMPPRNGLQGIPYLLLIAERDGYETSVRAEAFLIDRSWHTHPRWADQLRLVFEPCGIPISITWN